MHAYRSVRREDYPSLQEKPSSVTHWSSSSSLDLTIAALTSPVSYKVDGDSDSLSLEDPDVDNVPTRLPPLLVLLSVATAASPTGDSGDSWPLLLSAR